MKKFTIYSIILVGLFSLQSPVYAASHAVSSVLPLLLGNRDTECIRYPTFHNTAPQSWTEILVCNSSGETTTIITPGDVAMNFEEQFQHCKSLCDRWNSITEYTGEFGIAPGFGVVGVVTPQH